MINNAIKCRHNDSYTEPCTMFTQQPLDNVQQGVKYSVETIIYVLSTYLQHNYYSFYALPTCIFIVAINEITGVSWSVPHTSQVDGYSTLCDLCFTFTVKSLLQTLPHFSCFLQALFFSALIQVPPKHHKYSQGHLSVYSYYGEM